MTKSPTPEARDWEPHLCILESAPPADPQALPAWLRHRQRAIDALAQLPRASLTAEEREQVSFRIRAVKEKDIEVIAAIRAHQDGLRAKIQTSAQGRTALKGYQSPEGAKGRSSSRVA